MPMEEADDMIKCTKLLNDKLAKDTKRSFVVQLNIADGYTIAVKLWSSPIRDRSLSYE